MGESLAALSVPLLLRSAAADSPDVEAVVDGDLRLTYAELAAQAEEFARALVAAGVQPGEAVSIWAPNSATWVIASLGAHAAGAVLVPVNTRYKGAEARHLLAKARVVLLLVDQGFLGNDYLCDAPRTPRPARAPEPGRCCPGCRRCAPSSRSAPANDPAATAYHGLPGRRLAGGRGEVLRRGDALTPVRCATFSSPQARAAPPRG